MHVKQQVRPEYLCVKTAARIQREGGVGKITDRNSAVRRGGKKLVSGKITHFYFNAIPHSLLEMTFSVILKVPH